MKSEVTFGEWLKRRRRMLDLTQQELAHEVGCAGATIRKFEAGERRPSKQLATRLAECLDIAPEEHPSFIAFAGPSRILTPLNPPLLTLVILYPGIDPSSEHLPSLCRLL